MSHMPNVLHVYQKREQKVTNMHLNIRYLKTLKYEVKKMLKDELTGNPRWGQNVIDKVKLMIFVSVLAINRRFEVCFFMFHVSGT